MRAYLGKSKSGSNGKESVTDFIEEAILSPVRNEIDELAALGAPSGEEEQVEAIVDALEKALEEAEADPAALSSGNAKNPFAAAGKLAEQYGFDDCSRPL